MTTVRLAAWCLALVWAACAASACKPDAPDVQSAGDAPVAREPAAQEDRAGAHEDRPAAPRVAFLGDSLSAGLHLSADEAFPGVLARRLRERGPVFTLINAGVSGDTTAGGLRRVDWILKQNPQVVVIELGANDGMRGVAVDDVERNLRATIEKVRAAGATPMLLGMRLPPSYGADYAGGFDAIYPRLAEELHVAFVPYFMRGVAGVPELNLEDGLHPTPAGHERLADTIEPVLRETLSAAARPTRPTATR